jgi:hypothetical protein
MKGRDHLEDLDVDGRIILKWTGGALCEHGNEPSGFIKGGEFVDS